jgi:hypothetical protein
MAKCSVTGRETQACGGDRSVGTRSLSGWTPVLVGLLAALSGVGCGGGGIPLEECAAGTYDDDGDPETACVAWTVCRAGEYVSAAGTAETDRECAACAVGEYSVNLNATSCSPWTACVAGQYVSAAGTAASDRTCTGCTSGTFSASGDAASCTAWTECVAGEYVSTAGQRERRPGVHGVRHGDVHLGPQPGLVRSADRLRARDGADGTGHDDDAGRVCRVQRRAVLRGRRARGRGVRRRRRHVGPRWKPGDRVRGPHHSALQGPTSRPKAARRPTAAARPVRAGATATPRTRPPARRIRRAWLAST